MAFSLSAVLTHHHSVLSAMMSASGSDGSHSITLSIDTFCASIVIVFLLGGCVGFFIGKRRRSHGEEAKRFGAHDVNIIMNATSGRPKDGRIEPDENGDSQPTKTTAEAVGANNASETDGEEEDGPTIVLRGSLDLMASKWGEGKPRSTKCHVNGNPAASSSAVVEYLSPDEMTELLFSKVSKGGDNISETLCLDEYCGSGKNGDKDTSKSSVPSPRSSAIDIVGLLPTPNNTLDENSASDSECDRNNIHNSEAPTGKESIVSPEAFLNLLSLIQKYSVNTSHPYFFNQLFGSLDPIALAAEIVALSVNTSVYTYETAPVFTLLEREVMGQIGKLVFGNNKDDNDDYTNDNEGDGIDIIRDTEEELEDDEEFEGEGLMIPGGSLANLTAMHAARHRWKVMNGFTKETQATLDDEVSMISAGNEGAEEQSYWVGEEEKKLEDFPPHDIMSTVDENETGEAQREHFVLSQQQTDDNVYDDNRSTPDMVAFVSSEAHYSFSKSARVLGLREDDLIVIPTHSDGRMDVEILAKRIEELELAEAPAGAEITNSGKRKRVPFFVACTAGSTVRGSFDEIAEIVGVCRDYEARGSHTNVNNDTIYSRSIWVHVDGAWGGSAIFSSRQSVRASTHMDEIKHADSFTFNPHKMLGAPQQTTAFIVRHRHAIRDANAANAKYLFDPRKNGAEYDLGDLSYTCGRRTDAVKLWAMWKYHGRSGLGRRVDQKVDELEMFVEELRQREGRFALACKPWPFNVNFFYFPPRIRRVLEERGLLKKKEALCIKSVLDHDDDHGYIQIPDDIAKDLSDVSVKLKLRLHEAGEMIIPYQPLNNQKADCFRLVLAGKKNLAIKDIHHILDTMEKYGTDL